jgi:hypothetical protein
MSLILIRFSVIALTMMTLSGCFDLDLHHHGSGDPEPPYSVALNAPDTVRQNTVFSMTATSTENEGAVSYQWTLNDDVISEDPSHHTMLTVLGDFTLTVFATDEAGNEDTQSKVISVVAQASLNPDFSFDINVSDKAGYALQQAPVTINGTTVMTDQFGLAQFVGISQTSLMLVSASKAGYLTQTYQYSFDAMQESAVASLTLQNINPVSHIIDSTQATNITETELHTKLMLDANSFVDGQGNPVTGDVEITITSIDIRAVDNALLGGGLALTESGEAVIFISTGMADYRFSQNGSAVSLADGANAIIEMDLAVTTGDDGRIFVEGDTIEMWWFDPQTGFWIEDGLGDVQLSDTSETGLKLVASVNHFTTWNWDYYKQEDRSSITFNCLKEGLPLAVNESCQMILTSMSINRNFDVSSEGRTVINTPPNVAYSVAAKLTTSNSLWSGTAAITTVPGDNIVSVNMVSIATQTGYVQCRIINDAVTTIVPCKTEITGGVLLDQEADSVGFTNYRASFNYLKADVLDISSTTGSGLNQMTSIDTSNINGILDIEIIFDIQYGSLQCSATLNGSDMQYFPCDALVEDSEGLIFPVWVDDFSGNPLKANFTYSKNAQALDIEVASILDEARLNQSINGYYVTGIPTLVSVDLTSQSPVVMVSYDMNIDSLYSFKCVDVASNNLDCYIAWFAPMENLIFLGNINELSGPDILPTWMNGKLFIETPLSGSGNASVIDQNLYSDGFEVDTINKIITFTLVEGR